MRSDVWTVLVVFYSSTKTSNIQNTESHTQAVKLLEAKLF